MLSVYAYRKYCHLWVAILILLFINIYSSKSQTCNIDFSYSKNGLLKFSTILLLKDSTQPMITIFDNNVFIPIINEKYEHLISEATNNIKPTKLPLLTPFGMKFCKAYMSNFAYSLCNKKYNFNTVFIRDSGNFENYLDSAQLMIGNSLFNNQVVLFDFNLNVIRLFDSLNKNFDFTGFQKVESKFIVKHGNIEFYIMSKIDNSKRFLKIDFGYNGELFCSKKVLNKLSTNKIKDVNFRIVSANGMYSPNTTIADCNLHINNYSNTHTILAANTDLKDILIGIELLKKFQQIIIDRPNQTIYLKL